jgi:hypothetical protein
MPDHLRDDDPVEQPGLSDVDVGRIADALERRMLRSPQIYAPPVISGRSPRHVDLNDLIGTKEAAHLVGRHERTILRWMHIFDISEVVVGTKFISRSKLLAHAAWHKGNDAEL